MKYFKYTIPFAILALFVFFLDLNELFDQTLFYVFQARDLERARSILNGHALFFGPEMTGGGNLPGSLYYYLLAVALYFKNTWLSAWYLQLIILALGILFGFYLIWKDKKDVTTAFIWVVLISSAPLTYRFLQIFLNVSLLIPFCIIGILLINSAFSKQENSNRNFDLYLSSFLIGLGLQFHYSIVILFCTILFIFIFSKRLDLHSFSFKSKLTAIFLYILPSIPYYIWNYTHQNQNEFATNSGSSFNALGSLIYLIQFALHSEIDGLLIESLRKILFTFPFFLFFVLFSKIYFKFKKNKLVFNLLSIEHKSIYICLALSFIPYIDWYLSSQAVRYTMPFYISLIFITLHLFTFYLKKPNELSFLNKIQFIYLVLFAFFLAIAYPLSINLKFYLPVIAIFFLALVYFMFNKDKRTQAFSIFIFLTVNHSQFITKDFTKMPDYHWALFMPQRYEWNHIWNVIETYTGWDHNEAKHRIYYVGHHLEQDPELYLEEHSFVPIKKTLDFKLTPDGFFVSNRMRVIDSKSFVFNKIIGKDIFPKPWLIKQNIQSDIYEAILDKKIFVGRNLSDTILIAPFWIRDNSTLPDKIHNIGMGYYLSGNELILQKVHEHIGSHKISEDLIVYKANECPSHRTYCSNGALVKYESINKDTTRVKVTLIGNTISQTSPWINPDWTQAWIKPSISIECENNYYNFLIAKSVGFLREGSHVLTSPLLQANNGFVAPIEKTITLNCSIEKIKSITIKRENSKVESINSIKELGKLSITHTF